MATIIEIREAAQRLAKARLQSTARATVLQMELAEAFKPIYDRHLPGIDEAAAEEAALKGELQALVDASPQLFIRPRSITVNGVKAGYRKAEDTLDWEDDATVINRIRALPELQDMASVLIRTEESLNVAALAELDARLRRMIGVSLNSGVDQSFISFTDSDIEKVVKDFLASAAKRQGEDEPAKKKGKAKIKEAA